MTVSINGNLKESDVVDLGWKKVEYRKFREGKDPVVNPSPIEASNPIEAPYYDTEKGNTSNSANLDYCDQADQVDELVFVVFEGAPGGNGQVATQSVDVNNIVHPANETSSGNEQMPS